MVRPDLPAAEDGALPLTAGADISQLQRKIRYLEHAERVQRALFAIADLAGSDRDMPDMLRRLHDIVGELMYARNLYIALVEPGNQSLRFIYFVDEASFPPVLGIPISMSELEHSLTWHVIHQGHPLRGSVPEIASQVRGPLRALGVDAADWLGVPMLDGREVRGVLVVQSYDLADRFTAADQALLGFVARHVLTALQRRRAREELEHAVRARTAELAAANAELLHEVREREHGERLQRSLYHIAALASGTGSMEAFYQAVHAEVGGLLLADNFFIALVSDDWQTLHFPYYVNELDAASPSRPLRNNLTEYVLRNGEPVLLNHTDIARLEAEGAFKVNGAQPRSWLAVPLRCEGRTLGVMAVQTYSEDISYTERDQDLLLFVSHQIASSLERRRALSSVHAANQDLERRVAERTRELEHEIAVRRQMEIQLQHRVLHDTLTGLPNRAYMLEQLERRAAQFQREPDRPFAVMFLDVDHFKSINDAHGHHAGDRVLVEFGARLKRCLRAPDMVARLAGDEFAILLEQTDAEDAAGVALRVLEAMDEPVSISGASVPLSTSIGIAVAHATLPRADDLLRAADEAMYAAKSSGRGRFRQHGSAIALASSVVRNPGGRL